MLPAYIDFSNTKYGHVNEKSNEAAATTARQSTRVTKKSKIHRSHQQQGVSMPATPLIPIKSLSKKNNLAQQQQHQSTVLEYDTQHQVNYEREELENKRRKTQEMLQHVKSDTTITTTTMQPANPIFFQMQSIANMFKNEDQIKTKYTATTKEQQSKRSTQMIAFAKELVDGEERKRLEEEAERKRREEEKRRREEEERKRREEEKRKQEEEARQKAEEEKQKQLAEEAKQKQLQDEENRKKKEAHQKEVQASIPEGAHSFTYLKAKKRSQLLRKLDQTSAQQTTTNIAFKNALEFGQKEVLKSILAVSSELRMVLEKAQKLTLIIEEFKNSNNVQLLELVLHSFADKLVEQSRVQLTSEPKSVFAYSYLAVDLCIKYPQITDLILGHMHRNCIYTIPCVKYRHQYKKEEEYHKIIKLEDGDDKNLYIQRMCGYIALLAGIVQDERPNNPINASYGWTWLATMVNIKPTFVTPSLLHKFLLVAGQTMHKVYGPQFKKLLVVIQDQLTPTFPTNVQQSAKFNLKRYISEYLKNGAPEVPEGYPLT